MFFWILLLPTQLSKFFWPEWANYGGINIDFLAPVFYVQDFILSALLIGNLKLFLFKVNKLNKKLVGFGLVYVLLNIVIAIRPEVAIFRWLSALKFVFIGWLVGENKDFVVEKIKIIIPFWIFMEFFLSLYQVVLGMSWGGLFYWLGERKINYLSPNMALMSFWDETYLRAYGTFSHPNVLAAFVAVCLLLYKNKTVFGWIVYWVGFFLLLLTGGRVVFLSYLLCSLIGRYKWVNMCLGGCLVVLGFLFFKQDGWDVNNYEKRFFLVKQSFAQIQFSPIVGVGFGNNILGLDLNKNIDGIKWLQPVHNFYLLLLSELGLVFVSALMWQIGKVKLNRIMLFVLITGFFDHYWVTAFQTMGMLAVIIPLIHDKTDFI